ncbi:MAG: dTDP-4-dehydrorhamnose 3,5-epimerase [Lachnospiraceae bacterium]|nr:dTDP-4-dehydrorhamnose 3,5-epimerase [Lachnospiraceae bacterium]
MGNITVERNLDGIEGLCVITPEVRGDERGYFMETYNLRDMEAAGFDIAFVQHNQSKSVKGVLRGLHYQITHPQTKLVRAIRGEVYDVAVDLRKGSPTYGKYHGELLTEANKRQLLVPRGFAHGFLVISEEAEFCYLCDDFYHPGDEGGLAWNDPAIGVAWPKLEGQYNGSASAEGYTVDGAPLLLSERDTKWGGLLSF